MDDKESNGKLEGKINVIETLTVQELGTVSGSIEYQNMQIKLGGRIRGKIKVSDKIKEFSAYKKDDKKAKEVPPLQDVLKDKNT